ncbi:spore germination protein [Desulfotomaculum copahuensis]|uniref:Uncharacterized protein n=1 Tax=Desulfotomaculum copahuensis TaxID=1838280 RepID=A0A1B7LGL4_9FIRM|nr:spore germination protein [Desulfotomaculum copahuensis]OAT85243.1 hypothetical protein A6M21_06790 [Desulfotomaculum copahuensis]
MPLVVLSPPILNIFNFKINSLDRGSIVNFGPSANDNFTSYNKFNNGQGALTGDLSPSFSCGTVFDPDILDNPIGPAPVFENTL